MYVQDDGTRWARLVDADQVLDVSRGWTTTGVVGLPLIPRLSRPRRVLGTSATTGMRGDTVVATTEAPLWTGAATTFTIEANDNTLDVITVTRRLGERFRQPS